MLHPVSRCIILAGALALVGISPGRADPISITFTAQIGTTNSIDTDNTFNEGAGANLGSQIITGEVTIDPALLTEVCSAGGACYGDYGAGAISVSFSLNGVTATNVSTGTMGYIGNTSGGFVAINDLADGGDNYLAVGATSPDGMVQESIGVLFDNATAFSAYGNGDPIAAIDSLGSIGNGAGLVAGGITYMTPDEHLDATILGISVPEPAGLAAIGLGLLAMAGMHRTRRD